MTPRESGALHAHGPEQRTWWGRFWRYWLSPIFYWLDLLDARRRPSHSKVTWTAAFAVGLALLVFMVHVILADHDTPSPTELTLILSYSALVFSLAGGLDGFKTWAKTRGGGTVDALEQTASAEIQQRRASVGGDHEPTP